MTTLNALWLVLLGILIGYWTKEFLRRRSEKKLMQKVEQDNLGILLEQNLYRVFYKKYEKIGKVRVLIHMETDLESLRKEEVKKADIITMVKYADEFIDDIRHGIYTGIWIDC